MFDDATAPPDNQLAFTDQAMFLGQRATGQEAIMQCVWIYEHPVDFDGLRRFHQNFGYGIVGRRIERSPLPFGRHRWVSSLGPPADIDIAEHPRPRAELSDWTEERAQLPVDPEWGPGWHLGVQPFADGSTAITLVGSHCLADGGGALLAVVDAVKGNTRELGYPPPRSRTRLRAMASDLRQTVQGAPEVARALVASAKLAFHRRHALGRPGPSAVVEVGDCNVAVPVTTLYVDLDDWDARAKTLGGTSHSLVAGFAAKLSERLGRRAPNGTVSLIVPINDRTEGDTRANAVLLGNASVDPANVTTDLSGARLAIRQALKTLRDEPDEALQLLPLTPFIPKRAVRRGSDVLFGFADLPASCSNMGDLDPAVGRPDGTDAEYVTVRGVDRRATRRALEGRRGLLTVVAGRIGANISITVVAYDPGGTNSKPHLRELVASTVAEFDLTGVID
jgi:hypothetical protein